MPNILRAPEGPLQFPFLEEVHISNMDEVFVYPRFLLPNEAPTLRNLKLQPFSPTPEFAAATTLTTLELKFRGHWNQVVHPTFIPTQSLTVLSLGGDTSGWMLLPDNIHLPLLEIFKLAVHNPHSVMKAVIAPRLMGFEYSDTNRNHLRPVNFGSAGSKFRHVQRVTLHFLYGGEGQDALCQEFSGMRHASLSAFGADAFFRPKDQLCDSESVPANHWINLKSLTIYNLYYCHKAFDLLLRWLTKRLELGWPKLSVRLSGLSTNKQVDRVDLDDLYDKLQTCSNPELAMQSCVPRYIALYMMGCFGW